MGFRLVTDGLLRVAGGLHEIIVVVGERATHDCQDPPHHRHRLPRTLATWNCGKGRRDMSAHQPSTTTSAAGNGQVSNLSIRMAIISRQITRPLICTGEHIKVCGVRRCSHPQPAKACLALPSQYHQEPPASHLLLSLLTPHNPAALTVLPRGFFVKIDESQGPVLFPDCLVSISSVGFVSAWYQTSFYFFCSRHRDVTHAYPRPHGLLGFSIRQGITSALPSPSMQHTR
jgi:hypothetical protein